MTTHPITRALISAFNGLDDTDFGLGAMSDSEHAFRNAAESLRCAATQDWRNPVEVQVSAPWVDGLPDLPGFPCKVGFTVLWDDIDHPADPDSDEPATEAEVSCLISEDGTPGRWTLTTYYGTLGDAADQITEWLTTLTDTQHAHAAHRILADWVECEVDEDELDALPAWVRAHAN